jgi:hypothetical protein
MVELLGGFCAKTAALANGSRIRKEYPTRTNPDTTSKVAAR